MNMEITLLTFGVIADIVGKSNLVLNDVAFTDDLKKRLETNFPALKNINYTVAVNKQIISESTELAPNATVALLPPFSGG